METGRRKRGELALKCIREMRDGVENGRELIDWEMERKEFFLDKRDRN